MRFAALQKSLTAVMLFAGSTSVWAQTSAVFSDQASRPVQALFTAPAGQNPYVDAHGNPVVVPAGHLAPVHGGHHGQPTMAPFVMGTDPPVGYDMRDDVGMGMALDQSGPHYFDASGEVVYMTRDTTFGQDVTFSSLNIGAEMDGVIVADFVLNSAQLEYNYEPGFRIIGRYDLGPLSVLEFGYMGVFDWESRASFTDPEPADEDTGNLFSLFSLFGTNPPEVSIENGPMPHTERSITHSIRIDSDLQTAEMSYRRYWVGFMPQVSGTVLAGFRYTRLSENFLFSSRGEGSLDYDMRAKNDLAGFQVGGDMWIRILQGLRVGSEIKAGIYNNNYSLRTDISAEMPNASPPALTERFRDNHVAFISEASADVVADILPSWSIRAGVEALFINSIVLTGENFNTASPYGLPEQAPRVSFLVDQSQAFYYGAHLGLEYIW